MDKKRISVIVPVYNGEKTLEKCIECIENQIYDNMQIIISDDGSTDGSVAVSERLAEKYGNIIVVKNSHGGVSAARNAGIECADGEYISFIDCDDEIKPEMLSELVQQLEHYDAELAVVGIERLESNGSCFFEPYAEDRVVCVKNAARLYLKQMYFNSCSNKLYIADIIRKNAMRFEVGVWIGEDFLFNTQYIRHAEKTVVISEPMYTYRMSGATLIPFTNTSRFEVIAKMYDEIMGFAVGDNELTACVKRKICDEYLLAFRLYCTSGASFWEKVKNVKAVIKSAEYSAVHGAEPVSGIYGMILKTKSAFLINLYFALRGILHYS